MLWCIHHRRFSCLPCHGCRNGCGTHDPTMTTGSLTFLVPWAPWWNSSWKFLFWQQFKWYSVQREHKKSDIETKTRINNYTCKTLPVLLALFKIRHFSFAFLYLFLSLFNLLHVMNYYVHKKYKICWIEKKKKKKSNISTGGGEKTNFPVDTLPQKPNGIKP